MKKGKRFEKESKLSKILLLLTLITIVLCIINVYLGNNRTAKQNENIEVGNAVEENITNNETQKTETMAKLEELQKENTDAIGWLEIPNSKINYPVMHRADNDFYMNHNHKKEYSIDGALFLDKDYDWNLPSSNLLIYGHNNRGSSEMFVDLINYKDESYYQEHKTIKFTTNQEEAEYEIISVFLSRVYYKHEQDVFRYYYFINAENEEEYNDYVENCKKASLYDIEATAQYGDQLITLSTCEWSQEDGRLAVVARKVVNGDGSE